MNAMSEARACETRLEELRRVECASCGHALKYHRLELDSSPCQTFDWLHHPDGYKHGRSKQVFCKCREFVDASSVSVQLKLVSG